MELGNIFGVASKVKEFEKTLMGKNPKEEVKKLLDSGQVTLDQLEEAKKKAAEIQGMFKH